MDQIKTEDENKLPRGIIPVWASGGISMAVTQVLLMQITYYATEVVGFTAALAGTLILGARIFDGVTDLFAGYVIDKTKTRLGKARPYECLYIPLWIFVILLFSTPDTGQTGKIIWFFAMYAIVTAVIQTLLNASSGVLFARCLKTGIQRAKVNAGNGVIVMVLSAVCSIILPQLMNTWGKLPGGWTKIALVYGIPLSIIGMVRIIFVREINVNEAVDAQSRKMSLLESVKILFRNKYIFIFSLVYLLAFLATYVISGVQAYYFTYIIGDLSMLSIMGMLGLATPFFLLFFPPLMKKFGGSNLIRIGFVVALVGNVLKFIFRTNIPFILAGSLLSGLGISILTMMAGIFVVDCMDYGEWKTGKRIEGLMNSIVNFTAKVGSGLASAGIGFAMSLAGYVSGAPEQTPAALSSMVALFSIIPAGVCVIILVVMHFYRLDKELPKIKEELEARRAAAQGSIVL